MSLYRQPARDYGGDLGLLGDMKDAQRPVRAKRMNVHVSNRIFRPDDVTKRQSGWLREILGRKDAPDMFKNCNEEIKRKKNKHQEPERAMIGTICCRTEQGRDRRLVRGWNPFVLLLLWSWLMDIFGALSIDKSLFKRIESVRLCV